MKRMKVKVTLLVDFDAKSVQDYCDNAGSNREMIPETIAFHLEDLLTSQSIGNELFLDDVDVEAEEI